MTPRDIHGTEIKPGMRVRLVGTVERAPDHISVFVLPDSEKGKQAQHLAMLSACVLEIVNDDGR